MPTLAIISLSFQLQRRASYLWSLLLPVSILIHTILILLHWPQVQGDMVCVLKTISLSLSSCQLFPYHHHLYYSVSSYLVGYADKDVYVADSSPPAPSRPVDEFHPAAATAAVALAQLHHHRLTSDWDSDVVCCT